MWGWRSEGDAGVLLRLSLLYPFESKSHCQSGACHCSARLAGHWALGNQLSLPHLPMLGLQLYIAQPSFYMGAVCSRCSYLLSHLRNPLNIFLFDYFTLEPHLSPLSFLFILFLLFCRLGMEPWASWILDKCSLSYSPRLFPVLKIFISYMSNFQFRIIELCCQQSQIIEAIHTLIPKIYQQAGGAFFHVFLYQAIAEWDHVQSFISKEPFWSTP